MRTPRAVPPVLFPPQRMAWWSRLTGGKPRNEHSPRRVDYLSEAMALERQGDFDAALTSYRLALRDSPNDQKILLNIAIAYSRNGLLDDAIRSYRRALEIAPHQSGAHYGLSFLLLKRGDKAGAAHHLEAFLASASNASGNEMEQWVRHAQQTLATLRGGSPPSAPQPGEGTT